MYKKYKIQQLQVHEAFANIKELLVSNQVSQYLNHHVLPNEVVVITPVPRVRSVMPTYSNARCAQQYREYARSCRRTPMHAVHNSTNSTLGHADVL